MNPETTQKLNKKGLSQRRKLSRKRSSVEHSDWK